jgi:sulfur-carrier protein
VDHCLRLGLVVPAGSNYDLYVWFTPEQIAAVTRHGFEGRSGLGRALHLHATLTVWFAMSRSTNITIRVPRELRAYCKGASLLILPAPSVRAALEELERRHPSLYRGICDDTGAVRRHVNVFVNRDHMRDRDGLDTVLVPGDEIIILPSVSGG